MNEPEGKKTTIRRYLVIIMGKWDLAVEHWQKLDF